ncbi:hypothetical protein P8631_11985, partial [Guyparkeria sp. 1SP6A2]|nr:hypothetical protein [Guyparkeria sp. 1SP6A2]
LLQQDSGFQQTTQANVKVIIWDYTLNKARNEESDVPLWLELSGRTLKLRRMKQADIDTVFDRFGLASRATRHTFTNALRLLLPETELHALLGHSGGGWQRESMMSMAKTRYTRATWQAITTVLHDAGFHPVNPAGTHAI